jgi:hypothetical protein
MGFFNMAFFIFKSFWLKPELIIGFENEFLI